MSKFISFLIIKLLAATPTAAQGNARTFTYDAAGNRI